MGLIHLFHSALIGAKGIQQNWHFGYRDTLKKVFQIFYIFPHIQLFLMMTFTFRRPNIKYVTKVYPKTIFKYLGDYLALSFSRTSRLAILKHHYDMLANSMHEDFMRKIIDGQIELWEEHKGLDTYVISLTFLDSVMMEGDLTLALTYNSITIFTMSFVFAPGNPLKIPAERVLFITKVQGVRGYFDLVRHTTKDLNDISPPNMLLIAIEAIATALGISDIVGICVKEQMTVGRLLPEDAFYHAYDDFWQMRGGERMNNGMFYLPVPLPHKPLSMTKRHHRCRVKQKRQWSKQIMEQIRRTFAQKCMGVSPSSLQGETFPLEKT